MLHYWCSHSIGPRNQGMTWRHTLLVVAGALPASARHGPSHRNLEASTHNVIFPQAVRFGVLSWKKGTRRAGWVARGSERGRHEWMALAGPDGWSSRGRMGGTS